MWVIISCEPSPNGYGLKLQHHMIWCLGLYFTRLANRLNHYMYTNEISQMSQLCSISILNWIEKWLFIHEVHCTLIHIHLSSAIVSNICSHVIRDIHCLKRNWMDTLHTTTFKSLHILPWMTYTWYNKSPCSRQALWILCLWCRSWSMMN